MGDNSVITNHKFSLTASKSTAPCLLSHEHCSRALNKFYRQVKNGVYGDDKRTCWCVVRVWDKPIVAVINKV